MALQYFTLIHILISLVTIVSGFGMISGLLAGKLFPRWTAVYLATAVATSVTGFFFPFHGVTPAIIVGIISLVVLAAACYALYFGRLAGIWRKVFAVTAVLSLYFNTFVLVAQTFQKNPALEKMQTEPPFAITQGAVLIVFIVLGFFAVNRFRDDL